MRRVAFFGFGLLACAGGCSSSGNSGPGAAGTGQFGGGGSAPTGGSSATGGSSTGGTAGIVDAGQDVKPDAPPYVPPPWDGGDKSAACASDFGTALTDSYGRVDGTVLAIVAPADTQCPLPNNDHLVVQVTMNGAVYRMVVNLDVRFAVTDAPLYGPEWEEGWHTNVQLDYPSQLDVHSEAFSAYTMAELVDEVESLIVPGQPISVLAVSSGGQYAGSAHLVHRNGGGRDGAIILNPSSEWAHYLLFRFADQSF